MEIIQEAAIFLLQLAVILIAAKIGGEISVRYLRQPAVLGELLVGVVIGPFAFGNYLIIPGHGPLFPLPISISTIPVDKTLFIIAELAAVILLFMAGLETNLKLFLKYAGPAFIIALGGVIVPFFFGAWTTVAFGVAAKWTDPQALFMGAILTATSVGITARILGEIKRLDTPEGVTVLAGAVVDDVLGILVLSIVISIIKLEQSGGSFNVAGVSVIAAKALGFWVGIMAIGILLSKPIEKLLEKFKTYGAPLILTLALCFIASTIAEFFGLAMIIGAYAMGLALSKMKMAEKIVEDLRSIFHFLVPIFFVVTGMLVNLKSFNGVIMFGIVVTILAIVGKFFGCGLPALALGFNRIGAIRIGVGMVPRGEVALIVALVGLASGIIDQKVYGVAIMTTLVTTLVAPIALGPVFTHGGTGRGRLPDLKLVEAADKIEKMAEEQ